MAKKAVQEFVLQHPETKYSKIKDNGTDNKQNDKQNLELDLGDSTDFRSTDDDKQEAQTEAEAKYVLEDQNDDTSIPKWPLYSSPLKQLDSVKKELAQVLLQQQHWTQLKTEAQNSMKDINQLA
jgi:hypothetical protein